jgi:two-component system, cell cycle response regulator DivK
MSMLYSLMTNPSTMTHALIIEDNALNAEVLATLLAAEGVSWTSIESPHDLDFDRLQHLNLIFLDLEFRDCDGFEILRLLKCDERSLKIPVIAYTVHTSLMDRARREGFQGFLGKPLKPQNFAAQLKRLLNNQPVWEI